MKRKYTIVLSTLKREETKFFIDLRQFVKTGDFTLGKELSKFEKKFSKLIGTKYAVGVNSGTDAIKLSLKVIGIKPGDEIITAANTFVATVGAICELGAKPVFVDCDDSFCMNVNLVEKKITKKDSRPQLNDDPYLEETLKITVDYIRSLKEQKPQTITVES